jgi:hypothetical protein
VCYGSYVPRPSLCPQYQYRYVQWPVLVTKAMVTSGFIKCGDNVDHLIECWLLNSALPLGQSPIAQLKLSYWHNAS